MGRKSILVARLLVAGCSLLPVLSCLPEKQEEPPPVQAVPSAKAQIDKANAAADAASAAAARTDKLSATIDGAKDDDEQKSGEDDGER